MENKILNLLNKIIKEDEDTFIDITDMDDDSAAETVISKKDIFKKLRDKMSDKDRTPGGYEYGEIVSGQMGEELHGGQSKIDVASPKGKITADDFKKLRDGKKSNKSEVGENIFKKMFGKKEDPEVAREKDRKENPYLGNLGYDYDDIRGWHYVGPGQGRFDKNPKDSEDGEMEEGNEFSGALADAKKRGEKSFEVDGKTYPVKESIQLTEDELIDLIEKIVNEQTTVPVTNKSLKSSKTENDDYIKSVTKKMQTYLKDASKGKYEMNPTQFPKGNGELAKMANETKLYETEQNNLTQRLSADMSSDSWLSKNIRPMTLVAILLGYFTFAMMSAFNYNTQSEYVQLLGQWGMLIMSFYFGGRTLEKIIDMKRGK